MPEANHGLEIPFLTEAAVFLFAAAVVVPLLHRLRASPVLGFLIAGFLVGPSVFDIIEREAIAPMAELGVIMLLFVIGLELSFRRLKSMRTHVFGVGTAQVLVTATIIAAVAYYRFPDLPAAIVIGLALALSSTAVVTQLLVERGEFGSPVGRLTFAVLLFQDIAIVPILLVLGFLGPGSEGLDWQASVNTVATAVIVLGGLILAGRYLLRPLFGLVSESRSPELFVALTLLTILISTWATGAAGLSMALGAFIAGLMIAETEFRHQVEADIQPFKGLLLGLFFMAVGMNIDIATIAPERWVWIFAALAGLILVKVVAAAAVMKAFGIPNHTAAEAGVKLGLAGEFGFVIFAAAVTIGIIPNADAQFLLVLISLSIIVTPLMTLAGEWVGTALAGPETRVRMNEVPELQDHVIISGFGRMGQTVAQFLNEMRVPYVAVDKDATRVTNCRNRGMSVFLGDSVNPGILRKMGVDRAAALVVAVNEPEDAAKTIALARTMRADLHIFARAADPDTAEALMAEGAEHVIPETVEASFQLSTHVLKSLDLPEENIGGVMDAMREKNAANELVVIGGRRGSMARRTGADAKRRQRTPKSKPKPKPKKAT